MQPIACKRCLYTTAHPFGLTLNEDGICSGCQTHAEKTNLDWGERRKILSQKIPSLLQKKKKRDYDCIVPVRGTPEYFKVLDILINELGLNPLVVTYNSQFNSEVGIRNLDLLRDVFDVDLFHYTTNPFTYKKLIRETLSSFRSIRWPFIAGETQFPVQVAIEKKIPLIVWPLHQPTEQTGVHSYCEEAEMTRRGRHQYDLMQREPADLVTVESLLSKNDIEDLEYPENALLSRVGIRGIYLSNYYPWDSRSYSEEMILKYGALCALNRRTFDTYDRIDDCTYMTVHDSLKQSNLGYSRVTDSLCREIRFGRISRGNAVSLEKYYQSQQIGPEIETFCHWLGITTVGFAWLRQQIGKQNSFQTTDLSLSSEESAFISSFKVNAPPVWETHCYITYGKGLSV